MAESYHRAMRSTDPRVLLAVTQRATLLREGLERAQQWALAHGGDGGIAGRLANGRYCISGITSLARPAGQWRRVPGVSGGEGTAVWAPVMGSPLEGLMRDLAVNLLPIPGLPQWFVSADLPGHTRSATANVFVAGDAAFAILPFVPRKQQPLRPRADAEWLECSLADAKFAQSMLSAAAASVA